jgi:hypothetical protein
LVGASVDNPDGHFEDEQVVALQRRLIGSAGFHPLLPRPADWRSAPEYGDVSAELRALVGQEIAADERTWGFKDPQTCSLWPLWAQLFGELSVEPAVFFCVRPSEQVVRSMMVAYGLPQEHAEGVVLYRTMLALAEVDRPLFFVDHRRWRDDPVGQLTALSRHCGLDDPSVDVDAVVRTRYRPALDRQSDAPPLRLTGMLDRVDRLLGDTEGADYDQAAIDALVAEFQHELDDLDFVLRGVDRLRRGPVESALPAWARSASRRGVRVMRAGSAYWRRGSAPD